jgi:hypothetical protein
MRGKKAKELRKKVYGDKTFRSRYYTKDNDGIIHADELRKMYQHLKKII